MTAADVGAHAVVVLGTGVFYARLATQLRSRILGPARTEGRAKRARGAHYVKWLIDRLGARLFMAALAVLFTIALVATESDAAPRPDRPPATVRIGDAATYPSTALQRLLNRIGRAQAHTRECERALGLEVTPSSSSPIVGLAYARWVLARWQGLERGACRLARELGHPVSAARAVWGPVAYREAVEVGRCESHLSPWAANGQYLGIWQMGSSERERYGHGSTPLEQAIAAHAYYVDSGRDWSPWSCKPWGGTAA